MSCATLWPVPASTGRTGSQQQAGNRQEERSGHHAVQCESNRAVELFGQCTNGIACRIVEIDDASEERNCLALHSVCCMVALPVGSEQHRTDREEADRDRGIANKTNGSVTTHLDSCGSWAPW